MASAQIKLSDKMCVTVEDAELKRLGYVVGSTLGEGSYAKVKVAFSEKLNKRVAIKVVNRKRAPKDFQNKFLPRELEIMKMINHENIVTLYEVMHMGGKVYIIMEMAGHGDLLEYIKLRGALPEEKAKYMFIQLVNGIEYIHSLNVVHRDLKCENLLLDSHNTIKISDFGFAKRFDPSEASKTFCGSAAYAAPEILQGIPYEPTAYDIWSMGVILYIMVCGSMPYDDSNIKKMIKEQTERKVGFSKSKKISPACKDLIHQMLECNVKKRIKISDIKNHEWLASLREAVAKKKEAMAAEQAEKAAEKAAAATKA